MFTVIVALRKSYGSLLFPAAGVDVIIKGRGSDEESVAPPCSLRLLHVAAASGAADNKIGAEGAKALADALAPRQNPDGTWTHNNALSTLNLFGAPSLPAHSPPPDLLVIPPLYPLPSAAPSRLLCCSL